MISTRKWALALCLALSCSSYSNAQDVTGNLIYTTPANPPPPGSVYSWQGFINTESGGGGLSGGAVPAYNGTLGQFMFGYMPGTISYSMAVNSALSGTGIQITGIQYGLEYFNQDYSRGSLSATWTLRGNGNNILESYYHALGPTTIGWTNFDQTKTFTSPYSLANVGNLDFSISGQDDRFWAGYYGPQVRNPYARLTYGADQCSINPLSSPTCAGFSDALAARTTTTAATESTSISAETTGTPTTTTTLATVSPTMTAGGTTTGSSATGSRPALISPRLESIIKSVNASVASTVQATVQQSQEQARAVEQGLAQQSESQNQQQMSALGTATVSQRITNSDASGDAAAGSFTRPGDPAAAARMPVPITMSEPPMESRPQPRNTQPPAELQGGPSVVAFQAGADITSYTGLVMRDAQFYTPREIYRGQQTVDNRRALQGLGSDNRHREMVDQQYRR